MNFWQQQADTGPIVALAPMDGYCDSAFRYINKVVAPDIVVFSEFYSADGLKHNPRLAEKVLPHYEEEKPVIFQIFGNDPDTFVTAGKIIQSHGAAGIDINMGCPVKKVVKCGYGSGLMMNRDRAFAIVGALAENLDIPISVKTRLGWENSENLVEFGQGLENAGCSLLSIHARTFKQKFAGEADFRPVFDLKRAVNIPVLGNGCVKSYDDGIKKIHESFWHKESGIRNQESESLTPDSGLLSGFMIGTAAIGNPWCFLPGGTKPSLDDILDTMQLHAQKLIERKGEQRGCLEIRKHLVNYLSGFEGVKEYRKRLTQVESLTGLEEILDEIQDKERAG